MRRFLQLLLVAAVLFLPSHIQRSYAGPPPTTIRFFINLPTGTYEVLPNSDARGVLVKKDLGKTLSGIKIVGYTAWAVVGDSIAVQIDGSGNAKKITWDHDGKRQYDITNNVKLPTTWNIGFVAIRANERFTVICDETAASVSVGSYRSAK